MNQALTTHDRAARMTAIKQMVLDGLHSPDSVRAYDKALTDFLNWYPPNAGLNKATVQSYLVHLSTRDKPLSASTINVRLSAVKKLCREAVDNDLISEAIYAGIARIEGVPSRGVRAGNWLTHQQAQRLLDLPDCKTLKGLRDRAVLAVFLGAGLRRSELAALTFDHIQQREGRWAVVDLVGKRRKVRTVPIAGWVKTAIDEWTAAAQITTGRIFRGMNKGDKVINDGLSAQNVGQIVTHYGEALGYNKGLSPLLAAHDLRRTFAKLALKDGAALNQISLSLGHESLDTTKKYLGTDIDYDDAPSDHIRLKLHA